MLLQSLLTAGALAVTSNAFLVPFQVTDSKAADDLSIYKGAQKVSVDCSSCPYALKAEQNGKRAWNRDVPSDLEMEFDVRDNAIVFNGVPIVPTQNPAIPPSLTVSQKAKGDAAADLDGDVQDLRVSYSLEMVQKPFRDGNTLLSLTVSIMALENEMIRIDDIEIKAIKDVNGNLVLHSVKSVPAPANGADAKCSNVVCRVFAKFLSSLARAKATAKSTAHKAKSHCVKCFRCVLRFMRHKGHHAHSNHGSGAHRHPDGTIELPTHIKSHPNAPNGHMQMYHGSASHKGFFQRVGHIFWITFKIAFVPILIGVAFGMAASAVGLLVGQAVVFLWMRYRRHDTAPAYQPLASDVKEEVPPPYEDAPTQVEIVVDEKEVEAKA